MQFRIRGNEREKNGGPPSAILYVMDQVRIRAQSGDGRAKRVSAPAAAR